MNEYERIAKSDNEGNKAKRLIDDNGQKVYDSKKRKYSNNGDYSKSLNAQEIKKFNNLIINNKQTALRISNNSLLVECENDSPYVYKYVCYDTYSDGTYITDVYAIGKINTDFEDNVQFQSKCIAKFINEVKEQGYDNQQYVRKILSSFIKNTSYVLSRYNNQTSRFNDIGRGSTNNGVFTLEKSNRKTDVERNSQKFSLKSNTEETKDLIAVHNLNEEKLLKSLRLGGLPMPSIAIIKAQNGHNEFGSISLVFNKSTIDPKTSKYNKIFTADAYTPTYPQIAYKPNEDVVRKIREYYYNLAKEKGYDEVRPLYKYAENADTTLQNAGGEQNVINNALSDTNLMQMYLEIEGLGKVDNIEVQTKKYTDEQLAEYSYLIDNLGKDFFDEFDSAPYIGKRKFFKSNEDKIKAVLKSYYKNSFNLSEEEANNVVSNENLFLTMQKANQSMSGNNIQTEIDYKATENAIKEKIKNTNYEKWVKDLLGGIEEKQGIYNGKDPYTSSGNRRSFEALHWEHNLENVVKAMRDGMQQGKALMGSSIYGASQTEFKSIEEVKNNANRLVNAEENKEAYKEKRKDLESRFTELVSSIVGNTNDNYFVVMDSAAEVLVESVINHKTKTAMDNYIKQELKGWGNYSSTLADDLLDIVNELRALPTGYFEAKPQRAVDFSEVTTAIIPNNSSEELKTALNNNGIKFKEYEAGDNQSRTEALNSLEDAKFSTKLTQLDNEYLELAKNPEKNEARLRELVEQSARNAGYIADSNYQGTSAFNGKAPSSNGYFETKQDRIDAWENGEFEDTQTLGDYMFDGIDLMDFDFLIKDNRSYRSANTERKEAIDNLRSVLNNNSKTIKMYRSVPSSVKENFFRNGDWITPSRSYAIDNAKVHGWGNDYRIIENVVSVEDIWTDGNDIAEWGYDNGNENLVYKNTENNIKSADLVTYDDEGNVIPLSERFNEENNDIRYSTKLTPEEYARQIKALEKENSLLVEDNKYLKELVSIQGKLTKGKVLDSKSVDAVARNLVKKFNADGNSKELSALLQDYYSSIISSKELNWQDVLNGANKSAEWITSSVPLYHQLISRFELQILLTYRQVCFQPPKSPL